MKQLSTEKSKVDNGTSISQKLEFTESDEEEMDQQVTPVANDTKFLIARDAFPC